MITKLEVEDRKALYTSDKRSVVDITECDSKMVRGTSPPALNGTSKKHRVVCLFYTLFVIKACDPAFIVDNTKLRKWRTNR